MYKALEQELQNRYNSKINDSSNVLCGLNCINENGIGYISYHEDYGVYYEDLKNLCAGYYCGDTHLQNNIYDFLEDINYHQEANDLVNDTDNFIASVINEDWVY